MTGAKADIDKLDSVVANLNLPENSHGDYGRTVLLQALDTTLLELELVGSALSSESWSCSSSTVI